MAFGIDDVLLGAAQMGANYLSSSMTNAAAMDRQQQQQLFNAQQAEINRDWQERMSNTAYQRAMADMRLAGLNPILAYQKGGAAVPGGSAASAPSPAPVLSPNLGAGVTTALDAMHKREQVESMETQRKLTAASTANTLQDTLKKVEETKTEAQRTATEYERTGLTKYQATRTAHEAAIRQQEISEAIAKAMDAVIKQGYLSSSAGSVMRTLAIGGEDARRIIAPVTSAIGAWRQGGALYDRYHGYGGAP